MANVRIKLNYSGVGQLLKSSELKALLKAQAEEIAGRCGAGYASDTKMMGTRVIASAYTDTVEAMRDNLENNTLQKALDSVRYG